MSMSLDGYIAGPDDEPGNPGGDGFGRLHEWYGDSQPSGAGPSKASAEFLEEMNATGAVLVGRRTAEQVDHYNGHHHGVPVFVLSHRPPGPSVADYPLVTRSRWRAGRSMAKLTAGTGRRSCRWPLTRRAIRDVRPGVVYIRMERRRPVQWQHEGE